MNPAQILPICSYKLKQEFLSFLGLTIKEDRKYQNVS